MSDNKHKNEKVISNKYGRGISYNDELEDQDENYYPQNTAYEEDKKKIKEFTMRSFPSADW